MSVPIPARADLVVNVDSRCFCCFRTPKNSSPKKEPESLSDKIRGVFNSKIQADEKPPTVGRGRTISFHECK